MKRVLCLLSFLLILIFSSPADFSDMYKEAAGLGSHPFFYDPNTGRNAFPALTIPMGGLFEGMGTAHTAVAGDTSFLEANPASSAFLENTELAFYHNNLIADSNLEGAAYSVRRGSLGLGAGGKFIHVPFTGYNEWGDRVSRGHYSESVVALNASYTFLSSYRFSGIAAGINLKGAYRHLPESIYPDQSSAVGMVDLGVMSRFNFLKTYPSRDRNFTVGLSVRNIGPSSLGDPLPSRASAGFAYSPVRPMLIAFDFNVPFSLGLPPEEWEKPNFAAGMNVFVTDFFSMHTGFSYRGSNPRITIGSGVGLETVSFVINYTLDLTTQLQPFDRFSISARIDLGDEGRRSIKNQVDSYYIAGLQAYARGDLERAVRYWLAALELDPNFQPAEESLAIANRSLDLQRIMRDLNRVE